MTFYIVSGNDTCLQLKPIVLVTFLLEEFHLKYIVCSVSLFLAIYALYI